MAKSWKKAYEKKYGVSYEVQKEKEDKNPINYSSETEKSPLFLGLYQNLDGSFNELYFQEKDKNSSYIVVGALPQTLYPNISSYLTSLTLSQKGENFLEIVAKNGCEICASFKFNKGMHKTVCSIFERTDLNLEDKLNLINKKTQKDNYDEYFAKYLIKRKQEEKLKKELSKEENTKNIPYQVRNDLQGLLFFVGSSKSYSLLSEETLKLFNSCKENIAEKFFLEYMDYLQEFRRTFPKFIFNYQNIAAFNKCIHFKLQGHSLCETEQFYMELKEERVQKRKRIRKNS